MKNLRIHRWQRSLFFQGKRGFSLAEIAIVLGIIGIVLAGVWMGIGSINERNNINQAVQEIQTVSQNIITLYENRPFPAPPCIPVPGNLDMTSDMIAAGTIPPSMLGPTLGGCQTATTPWGGAGNFQAHEQTLPVTLFTPANAFWIYTLGVPFDACIALLLQMTACDPSQPECPMFISVDFGAVTLAPNVGPPRNWQNMPPAVATALCSDAGGGPVNINFEFRR